MNTDLIVLGSGVAGTTAALAAAEKGMQVLLCGELLGGMCLHTGCIPAKICMRSGSTDLSALSAYRTQTVRTLQAGLAASLQEKGVAYIPDNGTLCGKTDRFSVHCGEEVHTARFVLLASGSVARQLPNACTPGDIFTAEHLPQSAVICGGGASGLETAAYLCRMGAAVTVYEQGERLLPEADKEISASLLRALRRRGIRIHLKERAPESVQAETVVCACGRQPNIQTLGLASVGLSAVQTDAHMQTSVSGLYAAGDVCGVRRTAHAAMREAECAVRHMCGEADSIENCAFPQTVFTDPPCAFVGETGSRMRRAVVPLKSCGGYLAAGGDPNGVLVLAADESGIVCGLHMCGDGAPELLAAGCLLVQNRLTVSAVRQTVFPHPTVGEALRSAADKIIKGEYI